MKQNKIPKIIHYCWFGKNKLPDIFYKCIESWKKFCPDYEIKLWTEDNFDINIIPYCRDAYKQKKYALVSDYARLYILYKYGGIYLDIDVEMIKNIDIFLDNECFIGFEEGGKVAPGLILGAIKHSRVIKEIMSIYENFKMCYKRKHDICKITTRFLKQYKNLEIKNQIQYLDGITIYPKEYFCASNWVTREINITNNTYCVHHYCGSWMNNIHKFKVRIRKLINSIFSKKYIK